VGEAVRFGKQRIRNMEKRINERGKGRRQRLRREAENNLLGKFQDTVDIDNTVDTADDADDSDEECSLKK